MENVKLNFAHICDYASFGDGGKLNVLGIFKSIFSNKLPIIHPQMFVVTNIIVDTAGIYRERIELIREEDSKPIISPLEFNLSAGQSGMELGALGQITQARFDKAGKYKFKITVNDLLIKEIFLSVSQIVE